MCEEEVCQHDGDRQDGGEAIQEIDGQYTVASRIRTVFSRVYSSVVRLAPALERQSEISAACACTGVCPNCIGAGVGAAILSGLSNRSGGTSGAEQLEVEE